MITQPLISICIPVFNGEKYVAETIESVLNQNYSNLEIIVQDNASTDKTWLLLQSLAQFDSRLKLERNAWNCGMAANWNRVINKARGDYIMLLSADDLLEYGFLDKCVSVFQKQNVDVVTTNYFYLNGNQKVRRKMRVTSGVHQNCADLILLYNPFFINFTLFSKQIVDRLRVGGNFFTKSYYTCDYDLWIRTFFVGAKVCYLADDFLGTYRFHDTNLSRKTKKMFRQTALVLFSHKKKLKECFPFVYRFTLVRLIYRVIRIVVRSRYLDWRLLRTLLREVLH